MMAMVSGLPVSVLNIQLPFFILAPEMDIPSRWAGGIHQALKLQGCDHIREFPIAILFHPPGVKRLVACGNNDVTDIQDDFLVGLIQVDAVRDRAGFNAGLAFPVFKVDAGLGIDEVFVRNRLRKGNVYGFSFYQAFIPFGYTLAGTFFRAGKARIAFAVIDVTRFLFDGDIKIADIPLDFVYFAVGHHGNIFVLQNRIHLGCQNTGGTIQCGKRFIKLRHVPADGGIFLYQIDFLAGFGGIVGWAAVGFVEHSNPAVDVHLDSATAALEIKDQHLSILGIAGTTTESLSIATNVTSKREGRKDILKISGRELRKEEVDRIALIAPHATINIIRDYEVIEKKGVTVPPVIRGVVKCPNPGCISNAREPIESAFEVLGKELRCCYCDWMITKDIASHII